MSEVNTYSTESTNTYGSSEDKLKTTVIHSYDDYPSILHPEDIQQILRMGRRKTYEFLNNPPFHVKRVGKLIKVSKEVFINWLEGNEDKNQV
jgi:hypothetical protein